MKAMTILYEVKDGLYINVTNRCPCRCNFCIREEGEGAYGSDSLWLEHEPSVEEVEQALSKIDFSKYKQIVFCGYGEPLMRLDAVIEIAKYIKTKTDLPVRINTNGLADLIHNKPTAALLKGCIDEVSISLNAPTAKEYMDIAHPRFGEQAFDALLKYAAEVKNYVKKVTFTVVDVITENQIKRCEKVAQDMGITFRVRHFV